MGCDSVSVVATSNDALIFCSIKPEVAWAQREDSLLVTIRVSNIQDLKIEQTASTLSFSYVALLLRCFAQ